MVVLAESSNDFWLFSSSLVYSCVWLDWTTARAPPKSEGCNVSRTNLIGCLGRGRDRTGGQGLWGRDKVKGCNYAGFYKSSYHSTSDHPLHNTVDTTRRHNTLQRYFSSTPHRHPLQCHSNAPRNRRNPLPPRKATLRLPRNPALTPLRKLTTQPAHTPPRNLSIIPALTPHRKRPVKIPTILSLSWASTAASKMKTRR